MPSWIRSELLFPDSGATLLQFPLSASLSHSTMQLRVELWDIKTAGALFEQHPPPPPQHIRTIVTHTYTRMVIDGTRFVVLLGEKRQREESLFTRKWD